MAAVYSFCGRLVVGAVSDEPAVSPVRAMGIHSPEIAHLAKEGDAMPFL